MSFRDSRELAAFVEEGAVARGKALVKRGDDLTQDGFVFFDRARAWAELIGPDHPILSAKIKVACDYFDLEGVVAWTRDVIDLEEKEAR